MAGLTDCTPLAARLEAHVEQGVPLTADEQAHLRGCESCRADLQLLRDLQLALLEDVPAAAPPPELRGAVLAAAHAAPADAAPPDNAAA